MHIPSNKMNTVIVIFDNIIFILIYYSSYFCFFLFFFFNDTATTEIYTSFPTRRSSDLDPGLGRHAHRLSDLRREPGHHQILHRLRSEEHTSELQSRENLVCRLLLEK